MNIKDNLIFFFSIFPIFLFKSNFENLEITLSFFVFFILIIINFFILKWLINKKNIYQILYLSGIITLGIDNHLGLFNGIIQSNINFFLKYFEIIYIPALLILIIAFIIISIIYVNTDQNKITKFF